MKVVEAVAKEIGSRTREFYEFVLPPVDMRTDGSSLTVTVDVPGFARDDIKVNVDGNMLTITAKKAEDGGAGGDVVGFPQRPRRLDKKVRLPADVEAGAKSAAVTHADGVLTMVFPIESGKGTDVLLE